MKKSQFSPSRRQLLCLAAAAASGAGLVPVLGHADEDERDGSFTLANTGGTTFALANTGLRGNIVVIGGGMAGTTVAKYLRLWGGAGLNVTLVEPNPSYTSNIMSNLVLNNSRTVASLAYGLYPAGHQIRHHDQASCCARHQCISQEHYAVGWQHAGIRPPGDCARRGVCQCLRPDAKRLRNPGPTCLARGPADRTTAHPVGQHAQQWHLCDDDSQGALSLPSWTLRTSMSGC